ncbi:MAG: hypothetical protein PHV82_19145 [Victivallaceae bacterium]|nr:hypothetical protein [Victivallaceae bacterium]
MIKRGVAWHRWQDYLSRYWNSGLSLSKYCRQHNLNLKTASKWRLRFQSDHSGHEEALDIVPVAPPSVASLALPPQRGEDSGISLELGAIGVRLNRDFDAATLDRVLSLLDVRRCCRCPEP